jgi:hypothetical protein
MRVLLILVLFVGIPLLAGMNYMRNAPLDEELKQRPYAGISDADLASLLAAYGDEVKRTRSAVAEEPGEHAFNDPARFGHYGEKVEAFEKFQHSNDEWKQARGQLFGQQTTLEALQHENSIRERGLHEPLPRIWRRISTF